MGENANQFFFFSFLCFFLFLSKKLMPYFRKKQHFPMVGLVLFLRTGMAKLGFFALISLHPPKFGNCFKPRRFLLGVRKRNNSGLKKLLPGIRGAHAEQISVHLPAPSACPCPILWPHCLDRAVA